MNFLKSFFQKTLSFLRVRSVAGGLEVSDQVLRLVYFNGKAWQMASERLLPGVVEKGRVKDQQAFLVALAQLKKKVPFARSEKKKMNVVVSLSSVSIYSQTFTLPIMQGEDMNKAVDLNVRMLSPLDVSKAYFGWKVLRRDEDNLRSEVSVAFVEQALVDDITQLLYRAGFVTVGVESRALALVRMFREKGAGVDLAKSYLFLDIDNSGIDFLVVRNGMLYFEYAHQWSDIADPKGQIFITKFKEALTADLRQVMNFYGQHWPDQLAGVIVSAVAFGDQAEQAVKETTPLPVVQMTLAGDQKFAPEWFVALGCGLRGLHGGAGDEDINLSGDVAVSTFHEEQVLNFLVLWRVLIPVILGCLIAIFVIADNFLAVTKASIEASAAFTQQGSESAQMESLDASSTAFNQLVAVASAAEGKLNQNYMMIADINAIAAANGVIVDHLSFPAGGSPVLVSGTSAAESQIISFQAAIQSDPHFGTVTLPPSNIQQSGEGYMFSMTFPFSTNY